MLTIHTTAIGVMANVTRLLFTKNVRRKGGIQNRKKSATDVITFPDLFFSILHTEIGFEFVIITKGFIMIEWLKRAEMGKRV